MTQDDIRANFIAALDRADVELSDFEASFVESNLARFSFSRKQVPVIDRLMAKYADKIGFDAGQSKIAGRAAKEEAQWNREPSRFTARAPRPSQAATAPVPAFKPFQRPGVSTACQARVRKVEHVKERLKRPQAGGPLMLDWAPVKPGSVVRNGTRLEDWWIDHATGVLKACPFLAEGDEVEYDFYPNPHG